MGIAELHGIERSRSLHLDLDQARQGIKIFKILPGIPGEP